MQCHQSDTVGQPTEHSRHTYTTVLVSYPVHKGEKRSERNSFCSTDHALVSTIRLWSAPQYRIAFYLSLFISLTSFPSWRRFTRSASLEWQLSCWELLRCRVETTTRRRTRPPWHCYESRQSRSVRGTSYQRHAPHIGGGILGIELVPLLPAVRYPAVVGPVRAANQSVNSKTSVHNDGKV